MFFLKLRTILSQSLIVYRELPAEDTFVVVINISPREQLVDLSIFPRLAQELRVVLVSPTSTLRVG